MTEGAHCCVFLFTNNLAYFLCLKTHDFFSDFIKEFFRNNVFIELCYSALCDRRGSLLCIFIYPNNLAYFLSLKTHDCFPEFSKELTTVDSYETPCSLCCVFPLYVAEEAYC